MTTEFSRVELAPGYSIAPIINGCWQLSPDHGGGPDSKQQSLFRFAELVDHGFTTFDCADIYTGTEALLGEFRRTLADPDSIQVHTKLVPNKATLAELNNQQIDQSIDDSRRKLGVDTLDLVQFHWWDYVVDGVERLYERLLFLQSSGKIRLLGVTNFNTTGLKRLLATNNGMASMQTQYSLLDRRPEREMIEACSSHRVKLLAYGSLAGGFLSERYLGEPAPDSMNRSLTKYRLIIDEAGGWERLQQLLARLSAVAEKHASSIAAVAARWVLDQTMVAAAIVGIGTRSRINDHLAICSLRLDDDDRKTIQQALTDLSIPPGDPYNLERDDTGRHSRIIRTELQSGEES